MTVNLSAYRAIQPVMFVRIDITGYSILRLSDYNQTYTLDGEIYSNIGQLLSVSTSASEIRVTDQEFTVSISGIPAGSVSQILDNNPKGSDIQIKRAFFNPSNGTLLPVAGNPAIKFKGLISNYSMDEQWDSTVRTSTFTINLLCQSVVSVIKRKVAGRRTNPYDESRWFPSDLGMTRVPTIMNTNFQFGAPSVEQQV